MESVHFSVCCTPVSRESGGRKVNFKQHVAHAFGIAWVIIESKDYAWTLNNEQAMRQGSCGIPRWTRLVLLKAGWEIGNRAVRWVWGMCVVIENVAILGSCYVGRYSTPS